MSLTYNKSLSGKPYPFETQKGLLVALEPQQLGIAFVKSALATGIQVQQGKLDKNLIFYSVMKGVVKDSLYATTRSGLQIIAESDFNKRIAHKLMKDVKASALRKYSRYGSTGQVAVRIFKTSVWASILQYLAVFLVENALIWLRQSKAGKSKEENTREWREATRKQFITFSSYVICQSLGASVGSLIKPGQGTFVGGLLGSVLADQVPVDKVDEMLGGTAGAVANA